MQTKEITAFSNCQCDSYQWEIRTSDTCAPLCRLGNKTVCTPARCQRANALPCEGQRDYAPRKVIIFSRIMLTWNLTDHFNRRKKEEGGKDENRKEKKIKRLWIRSLKCNHLNHSSVLSKWILMLFSVLVHI